MHTQSRCRTRSIHYFQTNTKLKIHRSDESNVTIYTYTNEESNGLPELVLKPDVFAVNKTVHVSIVGTAKGSDRNLLIYFIGIKICS